MDAVAVEWRRYQAVLKIKAELFACEGNGLGFQKHPLDVNVQMYIEGGAVHEGGEQVK